MSRRIFWLLLQNVELKFEKTEREEGRKNRRKRTGWRKQERTQGGSGGVQKRDLWKPYLESVHQGSL